MNDITPSSGLIATWTPTYIPVDPGTKRPVASFIQGRQYHEFERGRNYTEGSQSQHVGHVTHPNVGMWAIDVEDVKHLRLAGTHLGKVKIGQYTLADMVQTMATYKSAEDPDHKIHIYVEADTAPTKWATNEWPYDIMSNGFVRAEPAYQPTGVKPVRLPADVVAQIEQAILADKELYRALHPRIRGNGQKITAEHLAWTDWHDADGQPEENFTSSYEDALRIAGQLRNWYFDDEYDQAADEFDLVMVNSETYTGSETWAETFERLWSTFEADHSERRQCAFDAIQNERLRNPSLPPDWVPSPAVVAQYMFFPGDGLLETWDEQPYPAEPSLLDCGGGPIVRPGTLGSIHAEEKQAKTWTALSWAVLEALRGLRVLYVDYENGARRFNKRVRKIAKVGPYAMPGSPGAKVMAELRERLKYMPDPEGAISDEKFAGYDLIIIDAAIDFVDRHTDQGQADTMSSPQAVNRVYRRLSKLARATNACIVLIDHSNDKGETSGARRKRGVLDWLAKAEKRGEYTAITWTFDRDGEDDDDLPAVYLIFEDYRLQSFAPSAPLDGRTAAFVSQGSSGDVGHERLERIFYAAGQHPDYSSQTRLAEELAGAMGMSVITWRREIRSAVTGKLLVFDQSGVSMGTGSHDWMLAAHTAGKLSRHPES